MLVYPHPFIPWFVECGVIISNCGKPWLFIISWPKRTYPSTTPQVLEPTETLPTERAKTQPHAVPLDNSTARGLSSWIYKYERQHDPVIGFRPSSLVLGTSLFRTRNESNCWSPRSNNPETLKALRRVQSWSYPQRRHFFQDFFCEARHLLLWTK